MHAIIETGGKQYCVEPGDVLRIPKLGGDVGSDIEFSRVLAVFPDDSPVLAGVEAGSARVRATITAAGRGEKIIVFKFKRKKQYKRTKGHRQDYTEIKVGDIVV
jgi:large subunit ribosomal protein L21